MAKCWARNYVNSDLTETETFGFFNESDVVLSDIYSNLQGCRQAVTMTAG